MAQIKHETESNISTLMSDNPKAMAEYKAVRGTNNSKKKERNGEVAWIIYYYLLSISHYNHDENHRFVYKNEFNVSALSRELEFSRTYFYTILDKLKSQHLIELNYTGDAILFPILSNSIQIDQSIFQSLLGYAPRLGIDLLKTYLFLCIVAKKKKSFTKRNIVQCLGHSDTNTKAYQDVDLYLDLFDKWELVYLRKEAKSFENLGTFSIYTVEKINKNSQYLEKQLEERQKEGNNCFGLTENEIKELEELLK